MLTMTHTTTPPPAPPPGPKFTTGDRVIEWPPIQGTIIVGTVDDPIANYDPSFDEVQHCQETGEIPVTFNRRRKYIHQVKLMLFTEELRAQLLAGGRQIED